MIGLLALMTGAVFQVTVSNPTDSRADGVPVVVALDEYGSVKSATVRDSAEVACQLDDLDGDGRVDELAFTVGVAPRSTRTLTVTLSDSEPQKEYERQARAYIKLRDEHARHPEVVSVTYPGDSDNAAIYDTLYGHGVCVEGRRNAWRVYIDNRQSIDLYGKRQPQLELDSTGFYTTRARHLEQGYGRDILWAGKSVAAGSFRGLTGNQPRTIDTVGTRTQRVIADGPVRAVVEVVDKGWTINGKKADMVQRYTQYGANPWFTVDVYLSGEGAGGEFCTGILKIGEPEGKDPAAPNHGRTGFVSHEGVAASWGENIPDKADSDLVETLGIGLAVSPRNVGRVWEDDLNYLVSLKPDADGRISYNVIFVSAMEPDAPADGAEWFSRVKSWADTLGKCTVTVRK